MNLLGARLRIVLGLISLLFSVLLAADGLGILPDERLAIRQYRGRLCEAVAINSSVLLSRGDIEGLQVSLRGIVAREPELLSAALRKDRGDLVAVSGDHSPWTLSPGDNSTETEVQVPLRSETELWGTLQFRFTPTQAAGWGPFVSGRWFRMQSFLLAASALVFYFFLGKVLEHLDPSQAVPGRVRSALNTLAEGLLVLDTSGRIVLANDSFARTVGKSPRQLVGKSADRLPWLSSDDPADDGTKPWIRALQEQRPLANVPMRLKVGNSEEKAFAVNCSPVLGHDAQYRGVLVSFDDITVIEEQRHELSLARDAADNANRAKSEFLSRMSHEIRSPMNAIIGFTEILQRGFEGSLEERQEYLGSIQTSANHLLAVINDVLDLSKVEAGKLEIQCERVPPAEILLNVLSVLRVRAKEKGLDLKLESAGKIPETIWADAVRVRQMLINLMANAIKFTEQGSVTLRLQFLEGVESPLLMFEVIDTGIGIPADKLGTIFEPFAQADSSITRRFGGTGLGLTISRSLADSMGGGLTVHSEVGKGTTFTLALPTGSLDGVSMIEMPTEGKGRDRGQSGQAQTTTELKLPPVRLLVVDDGPENRKLLTLLLKRAGASIETATNGQEALDMVAQRSFAAVLMDVQMPVMDGYTAATKLREQGVTIPIIALTANAMRGDEERCLAAGYSHFHPKPIVIERLVELLNELLAVPGETTLPTESGRMPSPIEADPATSIDRHEADSFRSADDAVSTAAINHRVNQNLDAILQMCEVESESKPTPKEHLVMNREPIRSTLPTEDPDFLEIVREFVDRLHSKLDEMHAAWESRDLDQMARLAHWLKGSGGSVGFPMLHDSALKLEMAAKEQRTSDLPPLLQEIRDLTARIDVLEAVAPA